MSTTPVIELRGLRKQFSRSPDLAYKLMKALGQAPELPTVHAVNTVDLSIAAGEVVGLVGESGCGKSTLGRMVAGLIRPSAGQVLYKGRDVAATWPAWAPRTGWTTRWECR